MQEGIRAGRAGEGGNKSGVLTLENILRVLFGVIIGIVA